MFDKSKSKMGNTDIIKINNNSFERKNSHDIKNRFIRILK